MATSRKTRQKTIMEKEIDKIDTFFSAEDVYENVRNQGIGIATVYRYLNEMKKAGKIHSYLCNRKQIYSKEEKSHCHFECEKTGKVFHFEIDSLDFIQSKIPGKITSFQIEVKGVCNDQICNEH